MRLECGGWWLEVRWWYHSLATPMLVWRAEWKTGRWCMLEREVERSGRLVVDEGAVVWSSAVVGEMLMMREEGPCL